MTRLRGSDAGPKLSLAWKIVAAACLLVPLTALLHAWPGRNVAAGPYSVGGSVSGLAGTLVLQDNGGDDLSVSSDGSFAFHSLLVGNAAYDVTVASFPTGQTCTVFAGSGALAAADITDVAVSCVANTGSAMSASDAFDRANGGLGPSWSDMSTGGLALASDAVAGSNASGASGDIRTAEGYSSDQYSQVELTSTQLTGSQWIGPAVRAQHGGRDGYVGIYFWNGGSPELMLFKRSGGSWTQLGAYHCGPLAAGTQLKLMAVGNTLAFMENGAQVITATDASFTGGAPGIMADGAARADNWSGGTAGFHVSYVSSDATIRRYDVISANNGYGPQALRVLPPTNPAPGIAHNFLIVLPVEPGLGTNFGDGLKTLQSLDAPDKYNLTIIEPTFGIDPWYANDPQDPDLRYETFITRELVPWIKANLAATGKEQIWLMGFSKSGLGAQDLILKHPDLFSLAASWDFPADISSYSEYSDSAASYGTNRNFQANYRLTRAFVDARKRPFLRSNRLWIGGYSLYPTDVSDYAALLTSVGVRHSTETPQDMAHRWDSGWVPAALAALYRDSQRLHAGR
jgi:hypothetical protein